MRLPKDIVSKTYVKPKFFLCETDKTKICELETYNTRGSFKFNAMSELTFDVPRVYNDVITGETHVNPFYDKIEALRLIEVSNLGYFELQGPELTSDGIEERKSCTAYSLEYTLSQKYLEDFYVNTGEIGSVEVTYANGGKVKPVTLYNDNKEEQGLSLLHLVLEKAYGWTIGYVDPSLKTLSRQFEVDRESIYDFLMNEVCEKFNCYIVFDTINNEINVYAESLTKKFIANGVTKTYKISPAFETVNTVSIDGYKTTKWEYNAITGILTLEDVPEYGSRIEVVDGGLKRWETDVFVTFDNLSQDININYDADNIKTVLSVTYGDDYDIREVNLGLPYLTDISYYYTKDWMGEDLYNKYTEYLQACENEQSNYAENSEKILELQNKISFLKNRLSLGYGIDSSVGPDTVGTYYIISGGTYPNYTYTEVTLPANYNANQTYYKINGTNVNEDKIHTLYSAIRKYFIERNGKTYPTGIKKDIATRDGTWQELLDDLTPSFSFVASAFATLKSKLTLNATNDSATSAIKTFLDLIWGELGSEPLTQHYLAPYKEVQSVNASAGFSHRDNENYWFYYPVTIMISTLNDAIKQRNKDIDAEQKKLNVYQQANASITNKLQMSSFFTEGQMIRLSAFLREDELHLDDIIETSLDDIESSFKARQDAMESGRIELQKLCQPQLQFSMTMANIYALPEFEPIIHQFQLGNVIKVGLRPDYIKQSRLLQVDINFDDFSDFSCEFGDLTNLRTQSDIHADLLSKAINAGKSVATNSSYWTRGSDQATATDLKIQQGLLDATTQIKAIDGTQGVVIDKYGIKLQKKNDDGSIDPHQTWLVNNMILMSDDGFKTSRSALGELTVEGNTYYGLIAEMVLSGYIEGTTIVGGTVHGTDITGGTINIGNGNFVVHEDGTVTMGAGGNTIAGYAKEEYVTDYVDNRVGDIENKVDQINNANIYRIEIETKDSTIISTDTDQATLVCKVYSWDSDITDSINASNFMWKRTSKDASSDVTWNNMPEHQSKKSITITSDDIVENSSFTCEVNLPEEKGGV